MTLHCFTYVEALNVLPKMHLKFIFIIRLVKKMFINLYVLNSKPKP